MSWLACVQGPDRGIQLELGNQALTLGRAPDNHIRLSEDKASRYHCQVTLIDAALELEDLNSTNGTVCGEHHIRGRKELLQYGDKFSIGMDIFEFRRRPDRTMLVDMKTTEYIPHFTARQGNEQTKFDSACQDVMKAKPSWIDRLLGR